MSASRNPRASRAIVVAVVVIGLAAAGGLAYLLLRPAAPAAVGLGSAPPGGSQPAASIGTLPSGAASSLAPGDPAGTWTIDPSIGSFSDFSSSFVGYRVYETLGSIGANTAVGRTSQVSGSLVLDGTAITSVDVTASVADLQSDNENRDRQLQRQALQTAQFSTATFKLTSPIELGTAPADGETITTTATGELTLHGVTKTVEIPIEARLSGDVATVAGSIDILFADYDIDQPTSFLVLSIEDHGTMEFQLHFRRG